MLTLNVNDKQNDIYNDYDDSSSDNSIYNNFC